MNISINQESHSALVDARSIYTSSSERDTSVVPQVPNGQHEQSRRAGQTIMSSEGVRTEVRTEVRNTPVWFQLFLLQALEIGNPVSVTK